jgi:hypothetical protein
LAEWELPPLQVRGGLARLDELILMNCSLVVAAGGYRAGREI